MVAVIAVGLDVVVAAVATPGAGMAVLSRIVEVSVDVALLGLVPALRADRATPGQAALLLQPVAADGHRAPGRGAIAVRFAVRWLPIVLVGAPAIPVVAIAELVTALVRHDRRSVAGLTARTVTATRDQVAAVRRASGRAAAAPSGLSE